MLDPAFLRKLERLSLVAKKVFTGQLKGERRSAKRGTSVEFADYRNYSLGDDLRYVDWNTYARLEKLFLKLFLEEEDLHVYLLVDASASMQFGEPSKFDYARRLAAALGYVGLANYDRVGAASSATRCAIIWRPSAAAGRSSATSTSSPPLKPKVRPPWPPRCATTPCAAAAPASPS